MSNPLVLAELRIRSQIHNELLAMPWTNSQKMAKIRAESQRRLSAEAQHPILHWLTEAASEMAHETPVSLKGEIEWLCSPWRQTLPGQVELYADINVYVLVEGDTEPLSTGTTDTYLYTGTSVGLSVVPVGLKGSSNVLVGGNTNIINLTHYGRNPQYANFDFPLRVVLAIDDGRQIEVTQFCEFTSSEAVISVVAGPSAYGAEATSTVGSSPRITAGGGACTIDVAEIESGDGGEFSPIYATLEASISGQGVSPASTIVGVIERLPREFRYKEVSPIVARYNPSTTLYLTPVIVYDDGLVEDETGGGYVLMEFDTATNQGDGLTGGILEWDDQDYGYYIVSANPSVSTNVLVKCSWVDTDYPLLMGLRPFYVNILVVPN
jgi:hypothetical protein